LAARIKAAQQRRTPKREPVIPRARISLAFWSAPVLWRFREHKDGRQQEILAAFNRGRTAKALERDASAHRFNRHHLRGKEKRRSHSTAAYNAFCRQHTRHSSMRICI
jgi:hypothetical protein